MNFFKWRSVKKTDIPYETLFNEVPCFITVQNKDFKIIESNRRFKENFGRKTGEYCYKMYKNRPVKCENCPVEKTFKDGLSHKSEEILTCLNGRNISVIVYTTPLINENDEIEAVMEMVTDITEIKKLQTELDENQKRYRTLFDEVPCYISIQDKNLRIVDSNRRFKEDFGEEIGNHCYEQYKHRTEPCLICPVAETFKTGEIHNSEEVVTSKKSEAINVLCYAAPIRNSIGDITHVMEMSTNITQIRELESQLTSLGLLVGSVSHGIKGLLQGLDGGVYLLDSGFKRNDMDRIKDGWDMVQRNIDNIRRMVLDILYYAKDREPVYESINASELAETVYILLQGKVKKFEIDFRKNVSVNGQTFEADSKAMQSMLVNIMENSIDACRMDTKKTSHRINFNVKDEPDYIVFEISDNGIGIEQETKEKLFSLFFSSKGMEGTGLGLFIANKIVQKHKGKIEVDSSPNKGTTFKIRLPKIFSVES